MLNNLEREFFSSRKYALDIENLGSENIHLDRMGKSIQFNNLPAALVDLDSTAREELAVLSWRWDINPDSNSSRNVYIACQHAKSKGIRYLFLDKITLDQSLKSQDMLRERLEFSKLYQVVPVIAAYDHFGAYVEKFSAEVHSATVTLGDPFVRIIRRPWIAYEVRLFSSNPTSVTYVGHIVGLGNDFPGMVKTIWDSSLCKTILYVLSGVVGMQHIEELRYIIPEHYDLLRTAHAKMSRNDYLLTAAFLTQDTERINNDLNILGLKFDLFNIGEGYPPKDLAMTQDYYTRYDITFCDRVIGWWQTRHKFYPFEELRVWFMVDNCAEDTIYDFLQVPQTKKGYYAIPSGNKRKQTEPRLEVVFHEKDSL